jgi:hypothetical protein
LIIPSNDASGWSGAATIRKPISVNRSPNMDDGKNGSDPTSPSSDEAQQILRRARQSHARGARDRRRFRWHPFDFSEPSA